MPSVAARPHKLGSRERGFGRTWNLRTQIETTRIESQALVVMLESKHGSFSEALTMMNSKAYTDGEETSGQEWEANGNGAGEKHGRQRPQESSDLVAEERTRRKQQR